MKNITGNLRKDRQIKMMAEAGVVRPIKKSFLLK